MNVKKLALDVWPKQSEKNMFTEIDLVNFKRFSKAKIPLKRMNLFVGPNNSGKSSVLAAIKLLIQTLDSYDEQVPLLLNGTFGDFGTYKDIIYGNHRGRPLEIGFKMFAQTDLSETKLPSEVCFNLFFKYKVIEREILLQKILLNSEDSSLIDLKYSSETKRYNVESIGGVSIPSPYKPTISRDVRVRHFLPIPLTMRLGQTFSDRNSPVAKFSSEEIDIDTVRKISRIGRRVGSHFENSDYLGPVRTSPQRTYLFTGERRNRIGAAGEHMTTMLVKGSRSVRKKGDSNVLKKINSWLSKSQMAKEVTVSAISDRHYEIHVENYFSGEKQNIADVGYGHSQVLPVLVGGYSMESGSTFLVEQPELHLHPKAQAELGDFFLDLFENDVQTIVETHSEHMILRLQQHVADGKISPDEIAIYYIDNNFNERGGRQASISPEVIVLRLDDSGTFLDQWPEGFFPERLNESRKLAQIRQRRQSK